MSYAIPPVFERRAQVLEVVDGDTLRLDVDLGCDVHTRMTVRLAGVDAPETSTAAGIAARRFVTDWVQSMTALGQPWFGLRTVKDRREKYGRYLADLIRPDGTSLVAALLAAGHAVPYNGR